MFRTLVVPLDGSDLAERALPYALRLADAASGQVILVRVASAPPPNGIDGLDWAEQQMASVADAEAYLTGVTAKIRTRVPVTTRVEYGHAAEQILRVTEQARADGIVMATHGRTGLAHLLYGSVAEAVLANSPTPVLLLRARPGEAPAPPFNPSDARAAVPLDGSSFAEEALHTAVDLVGPTGELILLSVVERPDHVQYDDAGRVLAYLDQQEEASTRGAREYLSRAGMRLGKEYPGLRITSDVKIGEPATGIVMAAVDRHADLVVMATHGRTGVRRAAMGSVAGAVLRGGSTPLLLVGPHEAHRSADLLVAQGSRT